MACGCLTSNMLRLQHCKLLLGTCRRGWIVLAGGMSGPVASIRLRVVQKEPLMDRGDASMVDEQQG